MLIKIGDAVRLPHWQNCIIDVMDVGQMSFWGVLIDQKADEVIDAVFVAPLSSPQGDWIKALTLDEIISNHKQ